MYRLADKLLEQLKKLIRREFNRLGIFGFDELNAPRVTSETTELFGRLKRENEKLYLKVAEKAYDDACEAAKAAGGVTSYTDVAAGDNCEEAVTVLSALEILKGYEEEAVKAQESARALFSSGAAANMPTAELTAEDFVEGKIDILTLLAKSGLVPSKSEARRAVQQGGVSVDGEKVTDTYKAYTAEDFAGEGIVIKKGKKVFHKVQMA